MGRVRRRDNWISGCGVMKRDRRVEFFIWFIFFFVLMAALTGMCTSELYGSCGEPQELSRKHNMIIMGVVVFVYVVLWYCWEKDTGGFTYKKDKEAGKWKK